MTQQPRNENRGRRLGVRIALVTSTLVIVVLLLLGLRSVVKGPALTTLVVRGQLTHVSPTAVRAALAPVMAGQGFFSVNLVAARHAVEALPWVATVTVRRAWPHTVTVELQEEVPVARWNGEGLLDAQGKVFMRGDLGAWTALPALSGAEGSAGDVLADYRSFDTLIEPRGLHIKALDVDARGAATLQLSDGIEVRLGREDAGQRLARFGAVALPALGAQLAAVAYVDMRYTNGFAVGWRSTAAAPAHAGKHKEVRPNV